MRIAIVGAGVSGLVSAKYCLAFGHEISVFEQTTNYGGCWNYTDEIGVDENGLPVHSAMYQNLKTNLPKEIMVFEGLQYSLDLTKSYIKQSDVLDYIQKYVEKFDLEPHIKYLKLVKKIKPHLETKWKVTVMDAKTKTEETLEFDAIMVCNGHFFHRRLPLIPGMDAFIGKQMHSQDYKSPEPYKGKTVVVVGAGPSGIDIAKHTATTAKKVIMSYRTKAWGTPEADNIEKRPQIEQILENGCRFSDGSETEADVIIYCTGYEYYLPFLDADSGLVVEDNWVKYVYRHLVNIERPTMAIVGLTYGNSLFPMIDLMARYFLKHLAGGFSLPDKETMLESAFDEQRYRHSLGWPPRFAHKNPDHGEHLSGKMSKEADIKPIPNAIFKLHRRISESRFDEDCFRIVDDENFVQVQ
ncbi:PREDICTED: senecionine N-oxygenase-like [Nicrophorus vespilloides]|uniref:Flavin-containing monooxygenase n=1 Tax=Nicrophorus vespilloides TaxID=110193 RepID=A0ABM1M9Y6_NICVS|nr:PREDICTED: senecionine N-oxygenase-like [Nicrophorus vespilloides]